MDSEKLFHQKTLKQFHLIDNLSSLQHRNMYTIKGETDHRPRLDA